MDQTSTAPAFAINMLSILKSLLALGDTYLRVAFRSHNDVSSLSPALSPQPTHNKTNTGGSGWIRVESQTFASDGRKITQMHYNMRSSMAMGLNRGKTCGVCSQLVLVHLIAHIGKHEPQS